MKYLKFKYRQWTRPELFLYGKALHLVFEHIIQHPKRFKSKLALSRYLSKHGIQLPDYMLRTLWWKFWNIKISKLHDWLQSLLDQGYVLSVERFFALPYSKNGKLKIRFYRPDLVLINNKKKHIVLIEIKSGARLKSWQIRNYRNLLRHNYKGWRFSIYAYLAGPDRLKKLK